MGGEGVEISRQAGRRVCLRCFRPGAFCVCGTIRRVSNRTRVFVLQHPRERFHAIGTARLARLGLSDVDVGVHWTRAESEAALGRRVPEESTVVLYPSPSARDLAEWVGSGGPRPRHLVVIDGTWPQSRTLVRRNAWLRRLPHVRLVPERPSAYRIRRAPDPSCLSTLESIVAALSILEPETEGLEDLLDAFARMIDRQVPFARRNPRSRRPSRRPRLCSIPEAFGEDAARWAVVHGEFARDAAGRPELFHVAAIRGDAGDSCATWLAPERSRPSDERLRAMGGTREALAAAPARASAWARVAEFLRGVDRLAVWRPRAGEQVAAATGSRLGVYALKGTYSGHRKRSSGSPRAVLESGRWRFRADSDGPGACSGSLPRSSACSRGSGGTACRPARGIVASDPNGIACNAARIPPTLPVPERGQAMRARPVPARRPEVPRVPDPIPSFLFRGSAFPSAPYSARARLRARVLSRGGPVLRRGGPVLPRGDRAPRRSGRCRSPSSRSFPTGLRSILRPGPRPILRPSPRAILRPGLRSGDRA